MKNSRECLALPNFALKLTFFTEMGHIITPFLPVCSKWINIFQLQGTLEKHDHLNACMNM